MTKGSFVFNQDGEVVFEESKDGRILIGDVSYLGGVDPYTHNNSNDGTITIIPKN